MGGSQPHWVISDHSAAAALSLPAACNDLRKGWEGGPWAAADLVMGGAT